MLYLPATVGNLVHTFCLYSKETNEDICELPGVLNLVNGSVLTLLIYMKMLQRKMKKVTIKLSSAYIIICFFTITIMNVILYRDFRSIRKLRSHLMFGIPSWSFLNQISNDLLCISRRQSRGPQAVDLYS